MFTNRLLPVLIAASMMISCGKEPVRPEAQEPPVNEEESIEKSEYAEGADISWMTQMEEDGQIFRNASGEERECTALMKEIGFNSIRLRVWADPDGGWCGKEDVVAKAKRAQASGMRIMIDFHYSDTWADPSNQNPPAAWSGMNLTQLQEALAAHTEEVLRALKAEGVDVEWVQVGNEINDGMLHPTGKLSESPLKFIRLANSGYDAVKAVYPDAKVILHVSNGHDASLFTWFFDIMKFQKANYDIIGMSLYPAWWENGGWCAWRPNVDKCLANIRSLVETYHKPVIICEVGMPVSEPQMSKEALQYILDGTKQIEECHGIFYWEPQTDGKWKPASYSELGWNAYDKGAFADGKPTVALDPFKD